MLIRVDRCAVIACVMGLLMQGHAYAITCEQLQFIGKFSCIRSHVALFARPDGSRLLLKQRLGDYLHKHFMSVLEVLGSSVAESVGIPCNSVQLVAADECSLYKHFNDRPATLHSFLPGVSVDKSEFKRKLSIKQRGKNVKRSHAGLTRSIIKNMSKFPMLTRIVALDTFIGNCDRDAVNILYEEETETFYAIDFGDTFKINLSWLALNNIKKLRKGRKLRLSPQEYDALVLYKNTLERLAQKHRPEALYKKLLATVQKAGFFAYDSPYAERYAELIDLLNAHKKFLFENADSVRLLIDELDDLLSLG